MPYFKKHPFRKKLLAFYAIISIGLCVMGFMAYVNVQKTISDNKWVFHTYDVLRELTTVRGLSKDNALRIGQYITTSNPAVLATINSEKDSIRKHFARLETLVADNPRQLHHVQELKPLITARIEYTDRLANVFNTGGLAAFGQLYTTGVSDAINSRIRDKVAIIEKEERELLNQRISTFHTSQNWFIIFLSVMIVAMAFVVFLMISLVSSQFRLRLRAEHEVNELNSQLEQKVEEKTRQVREQAVRFRRLVDNMIEGVQILGFDWTYRYLNDAAVEHSRKTREELIGHRIQDVYPGVDNSELFKTMQECMEQRITRRFDNDFTYPDGSVGCFNLSLEPTEEGLFILSMDISERKAREQDRLQRIHEAKEILNKISHDIRQPVSSILGVSNLLNNDLVSEKEIRMTARGMRQAAELLDKHTKTFNDYVSELRSYK